MGDLARGLCHRGGTDTVGGSRRPKTACGPGLMDVNPPGLARRDGASCCPPRARSFTWIGMNVLQGNAGSSDRTRRGWLLMLALGAAQVALSTPQFVLRVDRNPKVQAALLFWGSGPAGWRLVGAAPVSTGLPGRFEHFTTPLGVFDHPMANPDFRAEGTKNKLGCRGYGVKGMGIYDFGWVEAPRGWGNGAMGVLRLQMHATDPDLAAPRSPKAGISGCCAPTGCYMVVVDSERPERPLWSPEPVTHASVARKGA